MHFSVCLHQFSETGAGYPTSYNQNFSYTMNLFNHFDIKSYQMRTDLLSHMSQDQLMDFGVVSNTLGIEVVIFLIISFSQNMQFDKAVVLVLAPVFYEHILFMTNLGWLSVPKVSKLNVILSTQTFLKLS